MIDQFRIVQVGPHSFTVQEKGWFFWSQASYTSVGISGDMGRLHFKRIEEARAWIVETKRMRREVREKRTFQKRVVE